MSFKGVRDKTTSIAISACHPGRSPKYLFDEF